MGKVWQPQPQEVIQGWIDALMDVSEKLTEWESNFLENIQERIKYGPLTEPQENKLESIYAEKT